MGLVETNKLEIKTTTHYHIDGMNTDILIINNTKVTYNNKCGGTGGSSEWL